MIPSLQMVRRSPQQGPVSDSLSLRALLASAPAELRTQTFAELVRIASRSCTGATPDTHLLLTQPALRSLARRNQQLTDEIHDLDAAEARALLGGCPSSVVSVLTRGQQRGQVTANEAVLDWELSPAELAAVGAIVARVGAP